MMSYRTIIVGVKGEDSGEIEGTQRSTSTTIVGVEGSDHGGGSRR